MKRCILVILILFSGCDFKYPLYFDTDLIEVSGIEGLWKAGASEKTVLFVKQKPNEYLLYFDFDSTESNEYSIAKFLRLNGVLFMDFEYAAVTDTNHTHMIFKTTMNNSVLSFVGMDADYLINLALEKKIKIDYEMTRKPGKLAAQYIITEKTDKLQELVKKYCNDQNVFNDKEMVTYKKIR